MSLNRPFFSLYVIYYFGDIDLQRNFYSASIFAYLCRSGVIDDERPTGIGVYISVVLSWAIRNLRTVNRFSLFLGRLLCMSSRKCFMAWSVFTIASLAMRKDPFSG